MDIFWKMIDGPPKTIFHFKAEKKMRIEITQLAEIMENT